MKGRTLIMEAKDIRVKGTNGRAKVDIFRTIWRKEIITMAWPCY